MTVETLLCTTQQLAGKQWYIHVHVHSISVAQRRYKRIFLVFFLQDVVLLVEHGSSLDAVDQNGSNSLHLAAGLAIPSGCAYVRVSRDRLCWSGFCLVVYIPILFPTFSVNT